MPITISGNRPSPGAGETIQARYSRVFCRIVVPSPFSHLLASLPVSGNPSILNLCLGNGPFLLTTITTGPYVGSDHLPVIIAFPSVPPPPPTSHRPCWSFKKEDLVSFQTVKFNHPNHDPPIS
ncbi:hypothetical protein E2C01_026647 [Portunus trituberculatus]|uniref:Endonuclease/exonuclease/phosphatase domain-containing protein n=1 Tax=Portunus trituberculatus TaxID=210409 RepID=A0A5B7EJR9_PORTR|nr:hypothetical protein [Portunus trituberculatus]